MSEIQKQQAPADPYPFKYEVIERTFRDMPSLDNKGRPIKVPRIFVPGQLDDEGRPVLYCIDAPQVSAALRPADEFTKQATDARRKEIDAERAARAKTAEQKEIEQRLADAERANADLRSLHEAQGKQLAEAIAALKASASAKK